MKENRRMWTTCNQPVGHAITRISTGGYAQKSPRSLLFLSLSLSLCLCVGISMVLERCQTWPALTLKPACKAWPLLPLRQQISDKIFISHKAEGEGRGQCTKWLITWFSVGLHQPRGCVGECMVSIIIINIINECMNACMPLASVRGERLLDTVSRLRSECFQVRPPVTCREREREIDLFVCLFVGFSFIDVR